MNNDPMKSAREDYKPTPFYFSEENNNFKRYVVYNNSFEIIKQLLKEIISSYDNIIEILLKDSQGYDDKKEEDIWDRYYSETTKENILKLLEIHSKYIFFDGNNQLCIKDSSTGDYISFDDHGILFIYTDKFIDDLLLKNGIEKKKNELIYDQGHWHIRPKDADVLMNNFIKDLQLKKLED